MSEIKRWLLLYSDVRLPGGIATIQYDMREGRQTKRLSEGLSRQGPVNWVGEEPLDTPLPFRVIRVIFV